MLGLSGFMLLLSFAAYIMCLAVAGMGHGLKSSSSYLTGQFLPMFVFFSYMIFHFAAHPRGLVSLALGIASIAWLLFLLLSAMPSADPANFRIIAVVLMFFVAMWCFDRVASRNSTTDK
jgi:hypothetical protein